MPQLHQVPLLRRHSDLYPNTPWYRYMVNDGIGRDNGVGVEVCFFGILKFLIFYVVGDSA